MWNELTVIEIPGAFLVAPPDDPDDWVARFEKSPDFPARDWAERMATRYNARCVPPSLGPSQATPRPTSDFTTYHPTPQRNEPHARSN